MKKVLIILGILASVTAFSEGNKVEVRVGGDIMPQFSVDGPEKDAEFSYELGVEYRREVMPNFEIGGGIAYQDHGKVKKYTQNVSGMNVESTLDLYDSVPLYLTARYNFKNITDFTPYVKVNLGYSINSGDTNVKLNNIYTGKLVEEYNSDIDNGMYYGFGLGVEYKNFLIDLTYDITQSKAEQKVYNYEDVEGYSDDYKFDIRKLTLSVGYQFEF